MVLITDYFLQQPQHLQSSQVQLPVLQPSQHAQESPQQQPFALQQSQHLQSSQVQLPVLQPSQHAQASPQQHVASVLLAVAFGHLSHNAVLQVDAALPLLELMAKATPTKRSAAMATPRII